jgi:hypothetical protein
MSLQVPFTVPSQVAPPPAPGTTRLVAPGELQKLSHIQETDARTAVCRGLQEYLQQLNFNFAGTAYRFKKVLHTWAEPEDPAVYPSCCVYSTTPALYDASSMTPFELNDDTLLPNSYVQKSAELTMDVMMDCFFTSPEERMIVNAQLEGFLNPENSIYGFWLELPFYFNARACFELQSTEYIDEASSAQRRLRRLLLSFAATIPVLQFVGTIKPLRIERRTEVIQNPASGDLHSAPPVPDTDS